MMKLTTKKIEEGFMSHPLKSQDGQGFDAKVIVKYFNPCGSGTWLITEAEKQEDGEWLYNTMTSICIYCFDICQSVIPKHFRCSRMVRANE